MVSEVVDNDDVAGFQGSDELLFDIGQEACPVNRAIGDAGRAQAVVAKGCEEGHGAPVAMRCEADHAPAHRSSAADRRHFGLDPGLICEDQTLGVEPGLP